MINNRRSKILFVSYTADWTGPTNSLLLLLKYLRKRFDVAVLLPGHGLFSETLQREQIPFFSFPNLSIKAIPAIYSLIKKESFDLVYGNSKHGSSRNALMAAKIARKPFVCHIRESGWYKPWRKLGFLYFADHVITVSNAAKKSILRFVKNNNIDVVYNGVEPNINSDEKSDPNQLRAKLFGDINEKDILILSIGHIMPRKGQEHAIMAFSNLVQQNNKSIKLLLVGALDRGNRYVNKIKSMIDELKLQHRVILSGFVKDIEKVYKISDIYLHTALKDPHPRTLLEAMNNCLPAIGFEVDGVCETIVHGESGFLVNTGDISQMTNYLNRLVNEHNLRNKFGKKGKEIVAKKFSAKKTAKQIITIIDNVLDK